MDVDEHVPSLTFQNQNNSTCESRYNSRPNDPKFRLFRANCHDISSFRIVGPVLGMFLHVLITLGMRRNDPDRLSSPERPSTVKVSGAICEVFTKSETVYQRSQFFSRIPRGNVLSAKYERGEILS